MIKNHQNWNQWNYTDGVEGRSCKKGTKSKRKCMLCKIEIRNGDIWCPVKASKIGVSSYIYKYHRGRSRSCSLHLKSSQNHTSDITFSHIVYAYYVCHCPLSWITAVNFHPTAKEESWAVPAPPAHSQYLQITFYNSDYESSNYFQLITVRAPKALRTYIIQYPSWKTLSFPFFNHFV